MSTLVDEETREDRREDNDFSEIKHAFCLYCNNSPRKGDLIRAVCGHTKQMQNEKIMNEMPPDTCVVCADMIVPHMQRHYDEGKLP